MGYEIPIGVQLQNENKLDEMSIILEKFMDLVPTLSKTTTKVLPNGEELEMDDTKFFQLLITGDLLTAFTAMGTQTLRKTEKEAVDRLEGLIPVSDNWHARMALMKVIIVHNSLQIILLLLLLIVYLEETLV